MARKCLIYIDHYDILSPIGTVVVEHFKSDSLETELGNLLPGKIHKYGDTVITILKNSV